LYAERKFGDNIVPARSIHPAERKKSEKCRCHVERKEEVLIRERNSLVRPIPNDQVFIFAGGELPAEFLKKIGIQ
jgi:hypothetical protein